MSFGYSLGATIMMQLGTFQFSINTAAYQEFRRRSEYRWPSQDRFGKYPALQFTGRGEETISLQGVIYPEFRGGFDQVTSMRTMASEGQPLLLIDGHGKLLGYWVIESVEDGQSVFAAFGDARKIEFTLQLRKHEL